MDVLALALTLGAFLAAIVAPLVLLPLALERWAGLPYNSVRSRAVAWAAFAGLMTAAVLASPVVVGGWDAGTWAGFAVLVAFAAAWDLYDLKTRRIPRARHPAP